MVSTVVPHARLLIAGLSGGSGKTIVSLGLTRAFTESGISVQTFKKGPDYIDAKWLSLASHHDTTNLDPFLLPADTLVNLFWSRMQGHDLGLIEGNRGLYDGKDVLGSCSSAELAKRLKCPVIVVADCTKVTRTMAAVILGLRAFDPDVDIRVILNRTAGGRHRNILRDAIEQYTDVPVLGVLPKLKTNPIPERHMGLISDAEFDTDPFAELAAFMRDHVDLDRCLEISRQAPRCEYMNVEIYPAASDIRVRIGVARDAALWFYYQENFEALRCAGAELVEFSLLDDTAIPEVDALYFGGGFPETLAAGLSANESMLASVRSAVVNGMPVYAECGGLMYLGRTLLYEEQTYSMTGVFPLTTKVFLKPQGHGYMNSIVCAPNPFYTLNSTLNGHEFHYSKCIDLENVSDFCFQVERGQGMGEGRDGILFRNCLAGYTHMHALGNTSWAPNFVEAARIYKAAQSFGKVCPDIRL